MPINRGFRGHVPVRVPGDTNRYVSPEKLDQATRIALTLLFVALTFSKALVEISFVIALAFWVARKVVEKSSPLPSGGEGGGEGVTGETEARGGRMRWEPLYVLIVLFFLLSSLSWFGSDYKWLSLKGIGKIGEEFMIFFMVVDTFRTKDQISGLIKVLVISFLLVSLNGVWQYAAGKDLVRQIPVRYAGAHVRLSSSLGEPGIFGGYLLALVPVLACLAMTKGLTSWRVKMFTIGLVLLGFFSLFHTQSRGAWVSTFFALAFLGILKREKWLLAGLLALVLISPFFLPKSMLIHLDAERKEQSLVERYFLWDRAFQVIKARPWLGCGINTYVKSYPKYDQTKSWRVQYYYAHNGYLQMAAERGLPTLAVFLVLLTIYYRKLLSQARAGDDETLKSVALGLASGVAGILVFAVIDTVFETMVIGLLLWFLMGLAWSASRCQAPPRLVPLLCEEGVGEVAIRTLPHSASRCKGEE